MAIKSNDIVVCNTCGTVSEAKRRGSGGMELFLWLFLLWPIAVIYSIWRSGGGKCSVCGSNALLPITAPKAQEKVSSEGLGGYDLKNAAAEITAKKENQRQKDAAIWKTFFWVVGSIFIFGVISTIMGPQYEDAAAGITLVGGIAIYLIIRAKRKTALYDTEQKKSQT